MAKQNGATAVHSVSGLPEEQGQRKAAQPFLGGCCANQKQYESAPADRCFIQPGNSSAQALGPDPVCGFKFERVHTPHDMFLYITVRGRRVHKQKIKHRDSGGTRISPSTE